MSSPSTKLPATLVLLQFFLRGAQSELASAGPIALGGESLTQAQLETKLTGLMAPYLAVEAARQQLKDAETALNTAKPGIKAFVAEFKAAMKAYFGLANAKLLQFGIKVANPPKPLTTQQKVMRNARAQATRQARHTLGPKQRAAIKVTDVPDQVVSKTGITPVSSSTTPSNGTTPSAGSTVPTASGAATPSAGSSAPASATAS